MWDDRNECGRPFRGEEFLVVTVCPAADVAEFATRLREAVTASMPAGIAVTASVGVAAQAVSRVISATSQEAIEVLTACADRAMYEAKHGGEISPGSCTRITIPRGDICGVRAPSHSADRTGTPRQSRLVPRTRREFPL